MRINDIRIWAKRELGDAIFESDVLENGCERWWSGRIDTLNELIELLGEADKPSMPAVAVEFDWMGWET